MQRQTSITAVLAAAALVVATAASTTAAASTAAAPSSTRTAVIQIGTEALLDQMVDLPDPFPTPDVPGACQDIPAGAATFPLFDGDTITVAGTSATLCEGYGGWVVSWRGASPGSTAAAVTLLEPDGALSAGILANVTVGPVEYRYTPTPVDQPTDEYELIGTGLPDPPPPTTEPMTTATTTEPPAPRGGASPAVAVPGTSDYTG